MADKLQLGITITADGKAAEAALGRVGSKLQDVKRSTFEAQRAAAQHRAAMDAFSGAASIAVKAMASLSAALSVREVYRTISQFDTLNASLKTVTGSVQDAAAAMAMIKQFSTQTPYQVQEVTDAFIRLRSLGLDATSKSLQSFGNTASAMGKPLMQFIEAVADASTNEFERLKEFGIKAQQQGDMVTFTFQGVSTTVRKTSSDIQSYLLELGNTKFAGGMVEQMNTVGGAASNLGDAFSNLIDEIGNLGVRDALKKGFAGATEFINDFKAQIESIAGDTTQGLAAALERRIKEQQRVVAGLKGGLFGSGMFVDTDEINARMREIESMQGALDRLKQQLAQDAQSIGEVGAQAITQATFKGLSAAQSQVAQIVKQTAESMKVDPAWALAIAQQESGFNQLAKSAAGAQGVMQLMPGTAKQLGVNIADVNDNIKGGVLYLKQQQEQFKSLKLASAAYNAGPGNVQKYGGVPPFQETQNYVKSVAALYQQWQQVLGTQGTVFADAKEQAGELKNAFEQLKTHQDGLVSAAEDYAKVQVEKIKTSLAALEAERKATLDASAALLSSKQPLEDKLKILSDIAQQQDAYARRAAALAQQELSAQQSVIEARKSALQTELANADRYNLTIIEQAKLKQELAAADADLAVLAQQRAQAEIAAGQQVNDAAQQSLALKQKEQDAIGGVIAEYERQVEILNRLTQAQQAGASAEQLKLLSQYYQSGQNLPEIVSQEQLQKLGQYQLSIVAIKEAIGGMTKSVDDVREAQLRMNAIWDQTIKRIEQAASAWNELTNGQSRGIDRALVGLAKYGESVDQIGQKYDELAKQGKNTDPLGQTQFSEVAKATSQAVAETTLGLRTMFQVGSDGYKAMTAGATVALAAQDLLNISDGIAAVLKQLKDGDPYTASVRAAVVAAQVASLGIHIAGGVSAFGNSSSNRAAAQQAQTGTGTVLGDASAQSQSISKSLDLIASNTSNDLSYSARMLQALQGIESALSGASSLIFQSVVPSIRSEIANSGLDFGMKHISLFSGFDKEVTDYGLGQVAAQSLKSILKEGFKTLAKYADITDSFKVLGMELSSSTQTYIRDLDTGVTGQFNRVILGMVTALKEGSTAFGLSSDDFTQRLEKFKVDIGKLSLKDLSSEEAQKQIEAAFSKVFDEMASALAVGLRPFKRGGEGAAETFFRVAEGIQRATGELEQLGLQAVNYREIVNKQGDVAAEIARQTLLAHGQLVAGTRDYVSELTGSSEDIIAAYRKLVQAQNLLAAGFNVNDLDRTMINAAGGLDAFVSAMQSFNDAYLSQADNIAGQLAGLSSQFAQFGQVLPDSKDAFLALMQSIDTSTEAGKKLFGGLLQLADGFAKVQTEIDQIRQKYADKLDPMAAIRKTIEGVTDDFAALIAKANSDLREKLIKSGDPKLQGLLGDQAIAAKSASGASDELAAAQKRMDQVWEEIAQINAKGSKITKAERERLSQLTAESIYLDRQIPILESRNAAAQAVLKAAGEIIDEYIKSVADQNRADVLKNAATIMTETLADIMQGLAQTIQEAQQRLDNVLSFQRNLATQIAQLQGSQAIADLANARYGQANSAVNDYIGAIGSGARERDTETELKLLGDLQTAVMDRYNAEMALINEAIQEQTNALNEALQVEIDNINAAAQAQVDAVNATLDAQINAIQAASDAQIKAQQKADQEAIKAIQKQNDAAVKAAQKANDAIVKAQQKVYDAQVKALQKQQEAEVKALQQQQEAALKIWDDQLDAANTLRDAIKGIQEYAKSLLLGPQSTLSPEARLAEAQRQYQELAAKASGGDADALSKLSGSTDAYLEAAKQYYGSGSQYQSIFDGVKAAMDGLGAMSAPNPDSIQSHIDALRESQAAQLDALRESQADAVDALREQQSEQIDALRETMNDQIDLMREQQSEALDVIREAQADNIDAMRQAAQDQIQAARDAAQAQIDAINANAQNQIKEAQTRTANAIADLSDPNKNAAMKALKDETIAELGRIHDLSEKTRAEAESKAEEARRKAAEQAAEAIRLAREQLKSLDANLDFSAAQITALNNLMTGLNIGYQVPVPQKPAVNLAGGGGLEGVAAYAAGGYARPGWAMVGEQGPELVRFERPAQVLNATQTRQALSGDDGKAVAALEAIKEDIRAIVTTQSGANPQIIERLASIEGRLNAMERQQRISA